MSGSSTPLAHQPGVFVLGMHRSGTSVVSGILDRLGLDAGPPDLLFEADRFNSDGYWEHRPMVVLDDRMLRRRGGFASAPPDDASLIDPGDVTAARAEIADMLAAFDGPWFLKDPRQCLLLATWSAVLGNDDLAVVVNRDPRNVIRSLQHRNGYRADLAAGLWEAYVHNLLRGLAGRPSYFIQYESLVADPSGPIDDLAKLLADRLDVDTTGGRTDAAAALVRPASTASSSTATPEVDEIPATQRPLAERWASLVGFHERFEATDLPPRTDVGVSALTWRRRRIRLVAPFIGSNPDRQARLDRR